MNNALAFFFLLHVYRSAVSCPFICCLVKGQRQATKDIKVLYIELIAEEEKAF